MLASRFQHNIWNQNGLEWIILFSFLRQLLQTIFLRFWWMNMSASVSTTPHHRCMRSPILSSFFFLQGFSFVFNCEQWFIASALFNYLKRKNDAKEERHGMMIFHQVCLQQKLFGKSNIKLSLYLQKIREIWISIASNISSFFCIVCSKRSSISIQIDLRETNFFFCPSFWALTFSFFHFSLKFPMKITKHYIEINEMPFFCLFFCSSCYMFLRKKKKREERIEHVTPKYIHKGHSTQTHIERIF